MIQPRTMSRVGHAARIGEKRSACNYLVGKPEANMLLRRPGYGWENDIQVNIPDI
jgi:hypothetical protein